MRVLVLGATGFIGPPLVARLVAAGHEVTAAARSVPASPASLARPVRLDRTRPDEIADFCRREGIEALVDLLAMTARTSERLLRLLDDLVPHFVLLGSGDVYRNYELLQGHAQGEPELAPLREDAPLRTTRRPYRYLDPDASGADRELLAEYDKIPIEEMVRRRRGSWSILRLPMVYGPGDRNRRFAWAIDHMRTSREPLVLPAPFASWVCSYGYVENVGAAIARAVAHPAARDQVFNVGEARPVDHGTWAERWRQCLGWPGPIEVTDDPEHPAFGWVQGLGLNLGVPMATDTTRIRRLLGFEEPVALDVALERTAADASQRRRGR